jgi:hypothetical protein
MKQVFDVGRLSSPMWWLYRQRFKEKAHQNQKVPWTSKWQDPEPFKLPIKDFMNLPYSDLSMRETMLSDPNYPGIIASDGQTDDIVDSQLKYDLAKLKHSPKYTGKTLPKVLLIPSEFSMKLLGPHQNEAQAHAIFNKALKGRNIHDFDSIVIPFVIQHDPMHHHSILVEIRRTAIVTYDGSHKHKPVYPEKAAVGPALNHMLETYYHERGRAVIHSGDFPRQRDHWNCTMLTIAMAKAIFRGEGVNHARIRKLDIPKAEVKIPDDNYMPNELDDRGNLKRPETDRIIKLLRSKRASRLNKMERWRDEIIKSPNDLLEPKERNRFLP